MTTGGAENITRAAPPDVLRGEGREPLISIRELKVHFKLGGGTAWDRLVGGSPVPLQQPHLGTE